VEINWPTEFDFYFKPYVRHAGKTRHRLGICEHLLSAAESYTNDLHQALYIDRLWKIWRSIFNSPCRCKEAPVDGNTHQATTENSLLAHFANIYICYNFIAEQKSVELLHNNLMSQQPCFGAPFKSECKLDVKLVS
jgi:hypothetical protein